MRANGAKVSTAELGLTVLLAKLERGEADPTSYAAEEAAAAKAKEVVTVDAKGIAVALGDHQAALYPDGCVVLIPSGERMTPSKAATKLTGSKVNGWVAWTYRRPDGTRGKITELRPGHRTRTAKAKGPRTRDELLALMAAAKAEGLKAMQSLDWTALHRASGRVLKLAKDLEGSEYRSEVPNP